MSTRLHRHVQGLALATAALLAACERVPGPDESGVHGLPSRISRSLAEGGPNPEPIAVSLANLGGCALDFEASARTVDGAGWLSVGPLRGQVAPGGSTKLEIALEIVRSALAPGTYTGTIAVAGACAATHLPAVGSPAAISVNLTVTSNDASLSLGQDAISQDVVALKDSWAPIAKAGTARKNHGAAWTGREMIVFGGTTPFNNTGERYNPLLDRWTRLSTEGAPTRAYFASAWTGKRFIVWGGSSGGSGINTGALYDPATDSWTQMSTVNAPTGRQDVDGIWTGSRFLIWGGTGIDLTTGGSYDPVGDTWTPTSLVNVPAARQFSKAVWTGAHMVVWGGYTGGAAVNTGGRYHAASNTWAGTSTAGAPTGRMGHSMTWTGKQVVVWGGSDATGAVATGGRYDPASDTWLPVSTAGAPAPRAYHVALWTGGRLIVFGGTAAGTWLNDGGVYDPATDTWSPMTTVGAPAGDLQRYTGVWTGEAALFFNGLVGGAYR